MGVVYSLDNKADMRNPSAKRKIFSLKSCGLLSLATFGCALSFVLTGYASDAKPAKKQTPAPAIETQADIKIVAQNTRDVFTQSEPVSAKSKTHPISQLAKVGHPAPRLKPASTSTPLNIAKSIDLDAIWRAEEIHYGFADQRDFTGGQEALFTKYVAPLSLRQTVSDDEDRVTLKRGESLYTALLRVGINAREAGAASQALGEQTNIRALRAGTTFTLNRTHLEQTEFEEAALTFNKANKLTTHLSSLMLANDPIKRIEVHRNKNGKYYAETKIAKTTLHYATVAGSINDSLFASAERAGAPREIVAKLSNLFLFDVDFQREIRKGDQFEIVYEVFYDELGRPAGYGDVVYGNLSWLSKKRQRGYYRHTDNGKTVWFDHTGKSARRLLMKTPIEGARITSGFGRRKHPVLGYTKAHKGVDFGARRGTPIMAAGDGTIERANRFGSYGNYIKIRHANGYKTAYAHLKGFAGGIKKGRKVRQGQIIGYVGTTGRSTGPHLHYEVLRSGKQVNPMRIKVATGKELVGDELLAFETVREWADTLRVPQKATVLAQN